MLDYPKISIVTPSFNQGDFLEKTIQSVLKQSYPNLEYILIDGGSQDNSLEIIKKYKDKFNYWISEPDRGQSHAINKGFARSSGEIMGWLNSDDTLLPDALNIVARTFSKYKDIDVVFGDNLGINENSEIKYFALGKPIKKFSICYFNTIPQETLFWKRNIWEKSGAGLDEALHGAMDYELGVRFYIKNAKFFYIPKFLGTERFHAGAKSGRMKKRMLEEYHMIREKYFKNPYLRESVGNLPRIKRTFWFIKKGLLVWLLRSRLRSYYLQRKMKLPSHERLWS